MICKLSQGERAAGLQNRFRSAKNVEKTFLKNWKKFEKTFDKEKRMWYDKQAVAREDTFERSNKKKIVKSLKKSWKMLDKRKELWYNNSCSHPQGRWHRAVARQMKIKNRIERNDFYEQIMQLKKFLSKSFEN